MLKNYSPKVSVVIPAYNRTETICGCLDSVLNQTFEPWEVIVVDDCSSDSTADVVRSKADPRIRMIILKENSGAQAARNRGIKEAKGDWIAFQDSDDEWDPKKLEYQVDALRKVNFDHMTVIHTNCWRYDHLTGQNYICNLPHINGKNVIAKTLTSPGPMFPSLLTSKIALEKIGLLDENVPSYQEWDTAIRLAKICQFIHIQEPLFTYHLHMGDTISKDRMRDVDGYQYIVDKFKDDIISVCGEGTYNRHIVINAAKALKWNLFVRALDIINKCIRKDFTYHSIRFFSLLKMPGFYVNFDKLLNLIRRIKRKVNRRVTNG
ncbi:glycosyltransferase family 2 protein [Thermodesulfobacteriota bacterium]